MNSLFLLDENIKSKLDILGHDVKREIFKYTKHPIAYSILEEPHHESIMRFTGYFGNKSFMRKKLTLKNHSIIIRCPAIGYVNYGFPKYLKFSRGRTDWDLIVESEFELPTDTFDLHLYNIYKYYNGS